MRPCMAHDKSAKENEPFGWAWLDKVSFVQIPSHHLHLPGSFLIALSTTEQTSCQKGRQNKTLNVDSQK